MKNILFSLLLITIITSCGKQPISNFTWSPQNPSAGQQVQFTNTSSDAKNYDWNLGDMNISSEENPSHTYQQPGQYIIDLLARNGLKSDEKTITITIIE